MNKITEIRKLLLQNVTLTPDAATRFFKISAGTYGAHDAFLGITVPNVRKIAKIYKDSKQEIIEELLQSNYNEERLLALVILVDQYQKSNYDNQQKLAHFYLTHLNRITNWNLVDSSAHHILGHYLWNKDRSILIQLAQSDIVWKRRIAIIATWYFIRQSDLAWTFKIAQLLHNDPHNLIHKAVGWMLREAGKKDESSLISFLSAHAKKMPKTMLRYAIERLSPDQKNLYIRPYYR